MPRDESIFLRVNVVQFDRTVICNFLSPLVIVLAHLTTKRSLRDAAAIKTVMSDHSGQVKWPEKGVRRAHSVVQPFTGKSNESADLAVSGRVRSNGNDKSFCQPRPWTRG